MDRPVYSNGIAGRAVSGGKCAMHIAHFFTYTTRSFSIADMSYFSDAVQGVSLPPSYRRRVERLFREANATWIELTDLGYELYILGERHSTSYTLEDAIQEMEITLLGGIRRHLPESVTVMEVTDGVWGVDMVDLARGTREVLA